MPTTVTRSTPAGDTTPSPPRVGSAVLSQNASGVTSPTSIPSASASAWSTSISFRPVGIRPSCTTGRSMTV